MDRGGHLILVHVMSSKRSSTVTEDEEEIKKARNLNKALTNDSKSVFYATNKITKTLVKNARNSLYKKDIVFVNVYNKSGKNFLELETFPFSTPFIKKDKTLFVQRYIVLVDLSSTTS